MLLGLALASALAAAPAAAAPAADTSVSVKSDSDSDSDVTAEPEPKPSPEQRLAELDHKRVALAFGGRGYARLLGGERASGAGLELGLGVRVVRGLYIQGRLDVGAHALPVGAAGRGFIGIQHELRMSKWVRPSLSLGYSHLFQAQLEGELGGGPGCGCPSDGWDFFADAEAEFASRSGVEAGLGLRFPFRKAPRLSFYMRADAAYYFSDELPGRLQVGGSLGLSLVF